MVSFSCLDMSRAWSSGLATLVAGLLLCTGLETGPRVPLTTRRSEGEHG